MGGVARYLSRYITWIEVSVSMGDLEGGGCTVVCGDFESMWGWGNMFP